MSEKGHPSAAPGRAPRVFVGLTEIAGYYHYLVQGLRENGCEVLYIGSTLCAHRYGDETLPPLPRLFERTRAAAAAAPWRKPLRKAALLAADLLLTFALFLYAVLRCDAFLFGFGKSFLPLALDLPLLRLLGKTVVVNLAHGSDARPPWVDGAMMTREGAWPSPRYLLFRALFLRARIRMCERFAHFTIASPLTAQFFVRPAVNWYMLGLPMDVARALDRAGAAGGREDRMVRILHAPSNPIVKGTEEIRDAIAALRAEGLPIDYRELTNVPNAEVLRELSSCDLVVDQAFSDHPMAGLATEAASFGKPAVVAGHELDELKRFLPEEMWPPSVKCSPEDLVRTVRALALDAGLRGECGARAQRFARERWDRRVVARRFLALFARSVPPEWFFDPLKARCVRGVGLSERRFRAAVSAYVSAWGASGLCLGHRPDLVEEYLRVAREA